MDVFDRECLPSEWSSDAKILMADIVSGIGSGSCNYIGGYIFDYSKEGVLIGKTDIESMLDESDFGAATEMGGFALDKGQEV